MPPLAMTVTTVPTSEARGPHRVGPYRLRRELGRGGQGTVWLAEDTRDGSRVALKLLNEEADALARARLAREAEAARAIASHETCHLLHAQLEGPRPHLVFRLVRGVTLARRFAARTGEMPHGEATEATLELFEAFPTAGRAPANRKEVVRRLRWIEAAAHALQAVHDAGYVHRDVKPENIMVTPEGQVVLLDLGLATPLDTAERPSADEIAGTPSYMAPEQFTATEAQIDARTDVWSLGAVLFEAMTGMRPFGGAHIEALAHSVKRGLTVTPRCFNAALPRELDAIVRSALSVDQRRRPADMKAFADAVARVRTSLEAPSQARQRVLGASLRAVAAVLIFATTLGSTVPGQPLLDISPLTVDGSASAFETPIHDRGRPPDSERERHRSLPSALKAQHLRGASIFRHERPWRAETHDERTRPERWRQLEPR